MEKEKEKEKSTKHQPQEEDEHSTAAAAPVVIINIPPSSCHQQQQQEHCRVCQEEKQGEEEELIELGCLCKGGLSSAHRSCIHAWFTTIGSNRCEICREIAANVPPPPPQPHPNATAGYWVWRVDPILRPPDRQPPRGCSLSLWVALVILIGGLLLDVLLTITLGISPLPLNIIIGVIIVLGLGTAVRMAVEFIQENMRRTPPRVDNMNLS